MQQGFRQLHQELAEAKELVTAADTGAAPKQARLHRLWAHAARLHSNHQPPPQQQQHSSSSGQSQQQHVDNSSGGHAAEHGSTSNNCHSYGAMLPPPSKVRTWPLSPHTDLQLQVPPGCLLQHAARLAMAAQQQQQEQQAADRGPSQAVQQLLQSLEQQLQQHAAGECGVELSDLQAVFAPSSVQWLQSGLEDTEQHVLLQSHGADTGGSSTPTSSKGGDPSRPPSTGSSCTLRTDGASSSNAMSPSTHLNGPALPLAVSSSSSKAAAAPASGAAAAVRSHSSSGAAAAAAPAPAAQAVSALTGQAGVLPELLFSYASRLAARCLLELLVAEPAGSLREQILPLKALQLLTSVRQLEAAAAAAAAGAGTAANDDCNPTGSQQQGRGTEVQQAAQQGLVEHALMLLQHITQLRDAAAEASAGRYAAAPDANGQPPQDELQRWHSCSSGGSTEGGSTGSTTHMDAMPPHQFFAAHGPLSGVNAGVETVGGQLDGPAVVQACVAPPVGTINSGRSSSSSHAEHSSGTPEDSLDSHQHASSQQGDIQRVLHAAARNALARLAVSRQLSAKQLMLIAAHLLDECFDEDEHELMCELAVNGAALKRFVGCCDRVAGQCGLRLSHRSLMQAHILPQRYVVCVMLVRNCLWDRAGMPSYDPFAWCGSLCEGIVAPAAIHVFGRGYQQRRRRSKRWAADRTRSSDPPLDDTADTTSSSDSEADDDSRYAWGTDATPASSSSSSHSSPNAGIQRFLNALDLPTAGRSLRQAEHQAAQQGREALRWVCSHNSDVASSCNHLSYSVD